MTNGNEPAQPVPHTNADGTIQYDVYKGLSKREYFAARAMQAIVSSINGEPNYQRLRNLATSQGMTVSEWIGKESCKQADALIKALNYTP